MPWRSRRLLVTLFYLSSVRLSASFGKMLGSIFDANNGGLREFLSGQKFPQPPSMSVNVHAEIYLSY